MDNSAKKTRVIHSAEPSDFALLGSRRLLGHYRRCLGNVMHVSKCGFLPDKPNVINRWFGRFSFSIITAGDGWLELNGKRRRLKSPCSFLKVPPARLSYGPDSRWDELFFTFASSDEKAMPKSWKFHPENAYIYALCDLHTIRQYMSTLIQLARFPGIPGNIDKIDRLAELILLECTSMNEAQLLSNEELRIHQAESYIRAHFNQKLCIQDIASAYAFSETSFRRQWNAVFPFTPVDLIAALRISEACKLLSETDLPIRAIAKKVGYKDQLYFSRVFSRKTGISPSSFSNKKHQPGSWRQNNFF
jgi:AraC-like DNA-binding protein